MPDMDELNNLLTQSVVTVTFTKVDGSTRIMKCTKNFDHIPSEYHPSGSSNVTNPDIIRVYDVENEGWRSFHAESVISVVVVE